MKPSGIDIVVVNFFSVKKIEVLLKSIACSQLRGISVHIIVVSNSAEKELDEITENESLTKIINTENKGFGYACNQALPYCRYSYLLLLNPDTLVLEDTLFQSFTYMQEHTDITVFGVKHIDHAGKTAVSCSRFPGLGNYLNDITGLSKLNPSIFKGASLNYDKDYSQSGYTDQVMGAYMFIRYQFITAHGFMDTRFFVFGEDMDFCKRVWLSGGKVYYHAGISIVHEGSNSTEGVSGKKLCYALEGKLKYAFKYLKRWQYAVLVSAVFAIEPFTRLLFACISGNWSGIKDMAEGYTLFIKRRNFK